MAGWVREERECRDTALLTRGKAAPHQDLLARLVHLGPEAEPGRFVLAIGDRPPRQDPGVAGDVRLGVAGGWAERVQFQGFPAPDSRSAPSSRFNPAVLVRPERPGVVQIGEHGGGGASPPPTLSANRPVTWGRIAVRT